MNTINNFALKSYQKLYSPSSSEVQYNNKKEMGEFLEKFDKAKTTAKFALGLGLLGFMISPKFSTNSLVNTAYSTASTVVLGTLAGYQKPEVKGALLTGIISSLAKAFLLDSSAKMTMNAIMAPMDDFGASPDGLPDMVYGMADFGYEYPAMIPNIDLLQISAGGAILGTIGALVRGFDPKNIAKSAIQAGLAAGLGFLIPHGNIALQSERSSNTESILVLTIFYIKSVYDTFVNPSEKYKEHINQQVETFINRTD